MKLPLLTTLALCLKLASADPSLGACGPTPPTVPEFDPERVSIKWESNKTILVTQPIHKQYMGYWYTQYVIFAPYTPEGVYCSRPEYGSFENGTISVYNSGAKADGSFDQICGWAEQVR